MGSDGEETHAVTGAGRVAVRLVRSQILATLVIAALLLFWRDPHAAVSGLVGGAIGVATGLVMLVFVFREVPRADPKRILRNVYRGEAVKLGLTVVLFVVALRSMKMAPLPLLAAYFSTLLVYWISLLYKN
jgi:ATP synthase protein I